MNPPIGRSLPLFHHGQQMAPHKPRLSHPPPLALKLKNPNSIFPLQCVKINQVPIRSRIVMTDDSRKNINSPRGIPVQLETNHQLISRSLK